MGCVVPTRSHLITPLLQLWSLEGDSGGSAQGSAVCVRAARGPTGIPEEEDPGDSDRESHDLGVEETPSLVERDELGRLLNLGGSELESDDEEAPPLENVELLSLIHI